MVTSERYAELISNLAASKAVLRRLRRELPDHGRSAGVLLLAVLRQHGPLRLRDLAAVAELDLSVVSRHVAELTAQGAIDRRPNPEDRRSWHLAITDEGVRRHEEMVARAKRTVERALADWSDEDVAQLSTLLGRLHESFQAAAEQHGCAAAAAPDGRTVGAVVAP